MCEKFWTLPRPGSSCDGRKSFREERGGKQRAGKHHPAHRVFHAAFPENRPVSVYKISYGSLCHLGLLYGGALIREERP